MFNMSPQVWTIEQVQVADEDRAWELYQRLTFQDDGDAAAREQLRQAYEEALTARTAYRVQRFEWYLRSFRPKLYPLYWTDFETQEEAQAAYAEAVARSKVGLGEGLRWLAGELASSCGLLAIHVKLQVRRRLGLRPVPAWVDDLSSTLD